MKSVNIRLTDEKFFCELLNNDIEAMREIKALAQEKGDYEKARKQFAKYIRESLHPELYLTIPYELSRTSFLYPDETLEAAADRITRLEIISTSSPHQFIDQVDWGFDPTDGHHREWTWQINRHHEFRILNHQYGLTQNPIYAETYVKFIKSWIDQAVVPEQAKSTETKCWRTIETGLRSHNWMYGLHGFLHSEAFDDDTLVDVYKSLWEHGWRLRNFYSNGNWLIMEMNGLCQIGVICSVFKEAKEWKQHALTTLEEQLDKQVYPDGFHMELTTGYQQTVIENYLRVLRLLGTYQEPIPERFLKELEKMVDLNVKLVMPDGLLPDLNDGRWEAIAKRLEVMLPYYPDRTDWKWYSSNGQEGIEPTYQTEILPYAGFGVLREKKGQKKYYALMDAAPFGTSHQHEDKLNVIINCYGKRFLSEGGNYAYDDSEMRKYVRSTRSHNTIRIDGMDQNRRANYKWEPEYIAQLADMTWSCTEQVDWVEGKYEEGYGDTFIQVNHRRKLMFVKSLESLEPFFVVVDRMVPQDKKRHTYEILWHLTPQNIQTEGLKVKTLNEDGKNIWIQTAEVDGLALDIIKGQEEPEFQGWLTCKKANQGDYEPAPTLRYTGAVEQGIRVVTVIYPLDQVESPIQTVQATQNLEDKSIKLILKDGKILEINE